MNTVFEGSGVSAVPLGSFGLVILDKVMKRAGGVTCHFDLSLATIGLTVALLVVFRIRPIGRARTNLDCD